MVVIWRKMGGPGDHHAKWNKPDSGRQISVFYHMWTFEWNRKEGRAGKWKGFYVEKRRGRWKIMRKKCKIFYVFSHLENIHLYIYIYIYMWLKCRRRTLERSGRDEGGLWRSRIRARNNDMYVTYHFKNYSSHILHPNLSSPPPVCPLPLPQTHAPSVSPEKRAGLSGTLTKYDIASYNKTRHKPSHQGWARQPGKRKRVPWLGKRVIDHPQSHC